MVDLPAPDRPVNHITHGLLSLQLGARLLVDVERLPVHVLRAAQREVQQAGADRVVGDAVDQDEPAEIAVLARRARRRRPTELETAHADVVELELLGRDVLQRVDVDLVLQRRHGRRTVCVPIFIRYDRPCSIGRSCIQTMVASN